VLARKSSYVLRLEKLGYQLASVMLTSHASGALWRNAVWRNAVWIHPVEWAIGAGIDLGNGSGYDLTPESVAVSLTPDSD